MVGSGGLLFVVLRNSAVLQPGEHGEGGTESVVIGAGQSYQDALNEVCMLLKIPQELYTARFAQLHRGKSWMVAPSAWAAIEADQELELVVEKKQEAGKPYASGAGSQTAAVRADLVNQSVHRDAPPPQLYNSQPRSSQNSAIVVPATPEQTDESDRGEPLDGDEEVSDSDTEGPSASKRQILVQPGVTDEQNTPRQSFFIQRPSSPTSPRQQRRSPSPSPSNVIVRDEEERERIKAEDEPHLPFLQQPFASLEAELSVTADAFPSAGQPLTEQQQESVRSPTPPSRYLRPHSMGTVESEQDWAIGLNSAGDFDIIHHFPERSDKGKGRAPNSPAHDRIEGRGQQEEEKHLFKVELRSSQGQAPGSTDTSTASSASSDVPLTCPAAHVKLSSSQPAAFASTSRVRLEHLEEQEQAFAAIKQAPFSSQPSLPINLLPSKRKASPTYSSPGRAAKRTTWSSTSGDSSVSVASLDLPSPANGPNPPPPRAITSASSAHSFGSSSSSAVSTTLITALSRSSTSASSPNKRPLAHRELPDPLSSNAFAIRGDPAAQTNLSSFATIAGPATTAAAVATPTSSSQKSPRKPAGSTSRSRKPRSSLTAGQRALKEAQRRQREAQRREEERQEREAANALPRAEIPKLGTSKRFKMYLRAPNAPRTPNNAVTPLKKRFWWPIQPRGGDGFDLTIEHIFEDAEERTGWSRKEMRFVFCPGTERETKIWGSDRLLSDFRTLRELGCANGEAIDIEWVEYDPERSVLAEE